MHLLHHARKYVHQLGWSVIPIKKETKFPALDSWKEYQIRLPTNEELMNWFGVSKSLNLAVITGSISKLCVLDADSVVAVEELTKLGITSPISVKTGRGKHFYFRSNEKIQNQVGVIPDVDIRGEGGYCIAPPSIHETGKQYRWMVEPSSKIQLPFMPTLSKVNEFEEKNEKGWISEALKGLTNGNRNATFTKIVGNLHDGRRTVDDIFSILQPYCNISNFSEGELLNVIRSVTRYQRNQLSEGEDRSRENITIYTPSKHWELYCERRERKSSLQGPEMETGFPKLDQLLYGFKRGELYTVGARTGIGKTTFCLNVTSNLLRTDKRCLYLSTEMSFDTIWDRLRAINSQDTDEESFKRFQFFVSDIGNPKKEKVRQMIQEINPDVLILDHLQHLGDAITNRAQELGLMVKSLKNYAREFNICIIVASQLNRQADSTNFKTGEKIKPQLYHLKECGSIEEESTAVVLLNKEYQIDDTHDAYTLNLAKNRYGSTGVIELSFNKETTRMVEI